MPQCLSTFLYAATEDSPSGAATATDNGVTVTASLDITDGWVRPGAYAPVTLAVQNGSATDIASLRVDAAGPIETVVSVAVVIGGKSAVVVPVFYVGGELTLRITLVDENARRIARVEATPPSVRAVPADTAIVAVPAECAELSGARLDAVKGAAREALGLANVRIVRMGKESIRLADRCGFLDARPMHGPVPSDSRVAVIQLDDGNVWFHNALPEGVAETVQPQAYQLFDAKVWPVADRLRLWLWLGLMAAAVLGTGFLIRRRRWLLATGAMLGVAGASATIILGFGELRMARLTEARVCYQTARMSNGSVTLKRSTEHLALLESRGGKPACFSDNPFGDGAYARPVLASSEDLFRTQGTLIVPPDQLIIGRHRLPRTGLPVVDSAVDKVNARHDEWESDEIGTQSYDGFKSRRPMLLLQIVWHDPYTPIGVDGPTATKAGFDMLASAPDVIAALNVDGATATDHTGRTQPVEAWAVEWKQAADPNLAYAGRSLKWWADTRQEGPGPAIIVWVKDEPPEKADDGQEHRRMPAMVIYTDRPSPPAG